MGCTPRFFYNLLRYMEIWYRRPDLNRHAFYGIGF